MNYDDYPHPIRRSPRATHELQQVFEQLQLNNNTPAYDRDREENSSDTEDDTPPHTPRWHTDFVEDSPATSPGPTEPPPRSPSHVNPLRSHPIVPDGVPKDTAPTPLPGPGPAPRPTPQYRFSHPFRDQLYASRQSDVASRRRPANLVSYKPANQRLHPRLRRRTSLDTIASVTTTASIQDSEDVNGPELETPFSVSTLESEYPITPNVDLGPPPMSDPPKPTSLPESLRTASFDSTYSIHPTTPVSSAETHPPKGFLQKLKPGKRKDSLGTDGGGERLVIERTVSVDQTSYRSNSSSASNTVSSGTPSRYPNSETGNSRSSSTWTASSHDIGALTPEELKKCKKKGINPALFAEMKAARKGKWTSPIAGNTFLA